MSIRPARASDQAFVALHWTRDMEPNSRLRGPAGRLVDVVLERDDTRCLIRATDGTDRIEGYVVFAEGPRVPVIHWVYVRPEHRRAGIARGLLEHVGVERDRVSVYTAPGWCARKLVTAFPHGVGLALPDFLAPPKKETP